MNEHEWLTHTHPGILIDWLQSKLEPVHKFAPFILACRETVDKTYSNRKLHWTPIVDFTPGRYDGALLTWSGHAVNQMWVETVPLTLRCHFLREIWGNPFRPLYPCPTYYRNSIQHVLCPDPEEGYHDPLCPLRSKTVVDLATVIDRDGDYSLMPILGDALQDANCTNEDVLHHCWGEERCPKCLFWEDTGNWVPGIQPGGFGMGWIPCNECGATGWIPMRGPHVRGCWLIEIIKQGVPT